MSFLYTNWILGKNKTHTKNKTPGVNLASSSWGSMMSVLLPPPAGKHYYETSRDQWVKKCSHFG